MRRLVRSLRAEGGYTLVELVAVMGILLTVLTALTTLFVAGAKSELDLNNRFQAQQQARIAADRMRREVHCSNGITLADADSTMENGNKVYKKITVKLPGHCPTAVGGVATDVVYETALVAGTTNRYELRRAGREVADYLTKQFVFSYVNPNVDSLGKLHLDLPVNVNPNEGWKTWRLETDIVLRNTQRKSS